MKNLHLILLLLLVNLAVAPKLFSQNVSINSDGSLPDTSAMLDVSSTEKGFLLPRMTTAQQDAIILPATGLTIFNTVTNSIMINTGTPLSPAWAPLSVQGVIDTSVITNFYSKVRSLFSATDPITYANGLIGITQSTTATDGYLSSADWNTFNSKGSGTVTDIETGYGLSGGPITTTGTIIVDSAALSLQYLRITDTAGIRLRPVAGSNITITGSYPDLTFNASDETGTVSSITTASPITGGTITSTGTIGITQATGSTDGYLSSADWNTFNSKVGSIPSGDLAEINSSVLTISGGAGAVLGAGTTVEVKQANALQDGFLSASDWSAFNSKLATVDSTDISDFSGKVRSLFSSTDPITYANGTIGITQATTATDGYLSSVDWNTFNNKGSGTVTNIGTGYGLSGGPITTTGTIIVDSAALSLQYLRITDTANIRLRPVAGGNVIITGTYPDLTFTVNALGTGSVSSIATTSPITGGTITTTGTIGITQATGSTDGYLSSADWTNFNSKLTTIDTTNIGDFSGKVRSLFSSTDPITYTNGLIGITQATAATDGYLSSTDWNTFNNKGSGSVTDIETGYGLTGGPITTTGTIIVDSATLSLHYLRIADTAGIRLRPVAGSNINITGTYPDLTFNASDETGTVSSITTTSPITGGTITTTGTIGITQATGSTDGYLTSADWNTFNSKAGSITSGDLFETGSDVLTITGGTGAVLGSGASLEVRQATTDVDGYLSAADWNIFNDKVDHIVLNGDGVIYSGSSWGVNTGTATGSLTLNQQSKNKVLAGPTSGTNAPTFRLLVPSDLPVAIYPSFSYVAKTATYTASATDYTIDCTSGTFTVTLPTAAGIQGRVYVVKNSGTGAITVGTTASQTIDGSTTKLLNVQYSQVTVQSNGTNWIILSN